MQNDATLTDGPLTEECKADFSDIYTQPDPRAYYRTLGALDYQIPRVALPVFEAALAARRPRSGAAGEGGHQVVLDLCCSYGVNAALFRCGSGLNSADPLSVEKRYTDPRLSRLSPAEILAADKAFYSGRRPELKLLGLDASEPAIRYAVEAGLLDHAWAEDLESGRPSSGLAAGIRDVDMLISTGGVGYVGRPTFEQILKTVERPGDLWLVVFVLRVFDYGPIADLLADHGLITERLPVTFRQRRFANEEEREAALRDVENQGLNPEGREADGWFHANCFVSRPPAEAARISVLDLWRASRRGAR